MGWVNVMGPGRDFRGNGPVCTFEVARPHTATARIVVRIYKSLAFMLNATPQRVDLEYGTEEDEGTVRIHFGRKNGSLRLVGSGGHSSGLHIMVPMWDGLNQDAPKSKVTEGYWNEKTQTLVMSVPEELLGRSAKIAYRDDLGAKLGLA